MSVDEAVIVNKVETVLEAIYDPCSLSTPTPVSVVDLGLIRGVTIDSQGNVDIRIVTTAPGCVLLPTVIWRGVQETVTAIPGVRSVQISMDTDSHWSPDDIKEDTRKAMEARLQVVADRLGVRPHEWKQATHLEPPSFSRTSSGRAGREGSRPANDTDVD